MKFNPLRTMCLRPLTIKNVRYFNGDLTPWGRYIDVPCGSCVQCLERKISANLGRLKAHAKKYNDYALFVTLTIDDSVELVDLRYPGVSKSHVQPIVNAIKHSNERKGTDYSYFITSEYGSLTDRPHYHALLYGFKNPLECEKFLRKYYKTGFITISEANGARFNYVANSHISKCSHVPYYCPDINDGILELCNKPFVMCSRGIGYKYVEKCQNQILKDGLLLIDGVYYPLHPSLHHHLARLKGVSDPMLFYERNVEFEKQRKNMLDYQSQYDHTKLCDYLGIDANEFPLEYDTYHLKALSEYVNYQISQRMLKFKSKYSTKKTNTHNV